MPAFTVIELAVIIFVLILVVVALTGSFQFRISLSANSEIRKHSVAMN
jgi:hypothetical protein